MQCSRQPCCSWQQYSTSPEAALFGVARLLFQFLVVVLLQSMAVASAACRPALCSLGAWQATFAFRLPDSVSIYTAVHAYRFFHARLAACAGWCVTQLHTRLGLAVPVALAICQPSRNLPAAAAAVSSAVSSCVAAQHNTT